MVSIIIYNNGKEKKIISIWIVILLLTTTINSFKSEAQNSSQVRVSVMYIAAPLMKDLLYNPVMRIRIYVQQGKEINYRNIQLSLDEEAIKVIEKIDVLFRDDWEPSFLPSGTQLASINPSSLHLNIPINLTCKQGLNYIWISALLKKDADIDKKLKLLFNNLVTIKGENLPVSTFKMAVV